MLDKSMPYAEFWMYRSREFPVVEKSLPEGFHFEFYQEGDELEWATMEIVAAEFKEETAALNYFNRSFAPSPKS